MLEASIPSSWIKTLKKNNNNFIFRINFIMVHLVKTEPFAYCYGNDAGFYAQNPRLLLHF